MFRRACHPHAVGKRVPLGTDAGLMSVLDPASLVEAAGAWRCADPGVGMMGCALWWCVLPFGKPGGSAASSDALESIPAPFVAEWIGCLDHGWG
jgi:hypothetical protein